MKLIHKNLSNQTSQKLIDPFFNQMCQKLNKIQNKLLQKHIVNILWEQIRTQIDFPLKLQLRNQLTK